jgi:K+-transporting ATPase ATPase B chain
MAEKKAKAIWDMKIVRGAIWDSLRKLHPRKMMGNPVMFVVEVGSVVTTVLLLRDLLRHQGAFGFNLQITLWLWFTVLFANFAEAMAEGRGKAQAESLRKARSETVANRVQSDGRIEQIASSKLRSGDVVNVSG